VRWDRHHSMSIQSQQTNELSPLVRPALFQPDLLGETR
jgi:hypothetical protein